MLYSDYFSGRNKDYLLLDNVIPYFTNDMIINLFREFSKRGNLNGINVLFKNSSSFKILNNTNTIKYLLDYPNILIYVFKYLGYNVIDDIIITIYRHCNNDVIDSLHQIYIGDHTDITKIIECAICSDKPYIIEQLLQKYGYHIIEEDFTGYFANTIGFTFGDYYEPPKINSAKYLVDTYSNTIKTMSELEFSDLLSKINENLQDEMLKLFLDMIYEYRLLVKSVYY
jgi:hypothetical protein